VKACTVSQPFMVWRTTFSEDSVGFDRTEPATHLAVAR
jgi:hypothetical protein